MAALTRDQYVEMTVSFALRDWDFARSAALMSMPGAKLWNYVSE